MVILSRRLVFLSLIFCCQSFGISEKDQENIHYIIKNMVRDWNERDMAAFAIPFTSTATFLNIYGEIFVGQKAIKERTVKLHEQNNILVIEKTDLSMLWVGTAQALVYWVIKNDGKQIMKGVWSLIFMRITDSWMIGAAYNLMVPQAKL